MQYTQNEDYEKDRRIRNRFNQRIGRINEEQEQTISVTYDDGDIQKVNKNDVEVLPEVNHNLLIVSEQESFMHLLYDVVHIGVSVSSLQFRLDSLNNSFDLKYLLNTRMKNEKYSDDKEYPISKVLYEVASHLQSNEDEVFFNRKLKVLRMLVANGADLTKLNEPYSFHETLDLQYLKEVNRINDDIINYIKTFI
jgi:hypothetical protein